MEHKDYNGWTNYETWLLKLNLDNEESLYNEYRDMASDRDLTGQQLQDWLEGAFEYQEVGYKICDFWSYNEWREINWDEIAESINNEIRQERIYEIRRELAEIDKDLKEGKVTVPDADFDNEYQRLNEELQELTEETLTAEG